MSMFVSVLIWKFYSNKNKTNLKNGNGYGKPSKKTAPLSGADLKKMNDEIKVLPHIVFKPVICLVQALRK